jgi:predicted nucleic acid-binding protein
MTFVVDASIAVEYLLRTELGEHTAPMIESAELYAPELLDAEVLAVLRRELLRARLKQSRALEAIDDLRHWHVERISHRLLLGRAWSLRHNLSAYDALYVAAAHRHGATVLTADGPLSRAPAMGVPIQNVRLR